MIQLDNDNLPIAEHRAGRSLKVHRVAQEISVMVPKNDATPPRLVISPRESTPKRPLDERKFLTDAKKIHSWMIWYLPHGTVKQLYRLFLSEDIQ